MSETYSIQADLELPLEFEGEILHEKSSHWINDAENNRWFEIRIYKDDDANTDYPFILEIAYNTQWQGESCHTDLEEESTLAEIVDCLKDYNPLAYLQGYPSHDRYADKQMALEEKLQNHYQQLVTEVMSEMGLKRQRRTA